MGLAGSLTPCSSGRSTCLHARRARIAPPGLPGAAGRHAAPPRPDGAPPSAPAGRLRPRWGLGPLSGAHASAGSRVYMSTCLHACEQHDRPRSITSRVYMSTCLHARRARIAPPGLPGAAGRHAAPPRPDGAPPSAPAGRLRPAGRGPLRGPSAVLCAHVHTCAPPCRAPGQVVCTCVHAGGWDVPSRWQSRTRGPCGPSVCTCTHVHTTCRPISKPSLLVEEPEQPLPRTAPADAKDGRRTLLGEMRNSATEGGSSGIDPTCWRPRVCRVCPRMSCAAPWTQARGKARIDSPR